VFGGEAGSACQVPDIGCCSTPGFDQSHTPPAKTCFNRAISSAVNVTL
jgi:hypothetical protein